MAAYIYYPCFSTLTCTRYGDTADYQAGYPGENIHNQSPNLVRKLAAASGGYTNIYDWGGSLHPPDFGNMPDIPDISFFAWVNNNAYTTFSGSDYGIMVKSWLYDGSGDTYQWVGSGSSPYYHKPVAADEPIWLETFGPPSSVSRADRNWQVILQGDSTSTYVGVEMIGQTLELDRYWERPHKEAERYLQRDFITSGGQVWSNKKQDMTEMWELIWDDVTEDKKDAIKEFWQYIEGGKWCFLFQDFAGDLHYCKVSPGQILRLKERTHQLWSASLTIEKVLY